jgi:dihydroorotate dehydrogenase
MDFAGRIALPLLRLMEPESAHNATLSALKAGLVFVRKETEDPVLAQDVLGLRFANPIGLAAGFDKNAEVIGPMLGLGLGFVEVGTVTPKPQPGNPRPRIFRLAEDRAIINRLGFNSEGLDAAERHLARWRERHPRGSHGPVGVNLGKNKESADAATDYAKGARRLSPYADYLTINVSSPNTPGLRALQSRTELERLIEKVRDAIAGGRQVTPPPVLVKIAPDLTEGDLDDLCAVALNGGLAGLIVSNTTVARPNGLRSQKAGEAGGLSGQPLFAPSTDVLRQVYQRLDGKLPLIGVGGVASGAQVYAKIRAGASLVQLYTGLVYEGPNLIPRMKRKLAELLRADGFGSVADAVGVEHRSSRESPAPARAVDQAPPSRRPGQ